MIRVFGRWLRDTRTGLIHLAALRQNGYGNSPGPLPSIGKQRHINDLKYARPEPPCEKPPTVPRNIEVLLVEITAGPHANRDESSEPTMHAGFRCDPFLRRFRPARDGKQMQRADASDGHECRARGRSPTGAAHSARPVRPSRSGPRQSGSRADNQAPRCGASASRRHLGCPPLPSARMGGYLAKQSGRSSERCRGA